MVALADKPLGAKARTFEKGVNRRAHLRLRPNPAATRTQPEAALGLTDLWLRNRVRLTKFNRWYDASVGRWISEDPIGFAGGDANLYRYVGNGTHGTDATGTSITIITNHEGAGGNGHTGAIIGDISEGYYYYSYENDGTVNMYFETFDDAWTFAKDEQGYDSYYGYYTTLKEDAAARDEAERQSKLKYDLFRHNCEDSAISAARAGGNNTKNRLKPNTSEVQNARNADYRSDDHEPDWY